MPPKNSQSVIPPWNLVFCTLVKLDPQNVGVLWSDQGIMRTSLFNVYNCSWRHVRLCSTTETVYRFGAATLPIYNQTLAIAAAEEVNSGKTLPDEALLVL